MKLYRFGFESTKVPAGVLLPDSQSFSPGRFDGQISFSSIGPDTQSLSIELPESQSLLSISYFVRKTQQGPNLQKIISLGNIDTIVNFSDARVYTYLNNVEVAYSPLQTMDPLSFNCFKILYHIENNSTASVTYADYTDLIGTHTVYDHQNIFIPQALNVLSTNKYVDDISIDCGVNQFAPVINCKTANIIATGSNFGWNKLDDGVIASILDILTGAISGSTIFTTSTSSLCSIKVEEQFNSIDGINLHFSDLFSEESLISASLLLQINNEDITSCSVYPKKSYMKSQPMSAMISYDADTFNASEFQFKIKQSTS